MTEHGEMFRDGNEVVVRVPYTQFLSEMSDAVCLNPDAPENERICEKRFSKKRIYFPDEYEKALNETRRPRSFVVSMNGYSRITPDQCARYGIEPLAYEYATRAILRYIVKKIWEVFPNQLDLISGASYMGIDGVIAGVARDFNIIPLGFSCPRYMPYVPDDDHPVYVAHNCDEYSDRYIQSLDLLIATGGREVALKHDVLAACIQNKRIHFVDVLNSLSNNGGVPATIIDENGRTRVDNAAAAMGRNISFFDGKLMAIQHPEGDVWDAIFRNVFSIATDVCRRKMAPEKMFSV